MSTLRNYRCREEQHLLYIAIAICCFSYVAANAGVGPFMPVNARPEAPLAFASLRLNIEVVLEDHIDPRMAVNGVWVSSGPITTRVTSLKSVLNSRYCAEKRLRRHELYSTDSAAISPYRTF